MWPHTISQCLMHVKRLGVLIHLTHDSGQTSGVLAFKRKVDPNLSGLLSMVGHKGDDVLMAATLEVVDADVDPTAAEHRGAVQPLATAYVGGLAVGEGHVGAVDDDGTQPVKMLQL